VGYTAVIEKLKLQIPLPLMKAMVSEKYRIVINGCALMFSKAPLIGNSGANPKFEERE
jgi:hypothetical protein